MSVVTSTFTNSEGYVLGEKVIRFSDLSGKEIEDEREGATIIVEFVDKRRGRYRLDATLDEGKELAEKGKKEVES